MNVLLVEDDPHVSHWLQQLFVRDGHAATVVTTAEDALQIVRTNVYDLLLVDLGLPGIDGLSAVRELRAAGLSTPIIILTGRSLDEDIAVGLDAGADDFLVKPASAEVLRARIRAVLRRTANAPAAQAIGDLSLDRQKKRATAPAGDVPLTALEYSLLDFLMQEPGRIVSRALLLKHVWNCDFDPGTSLVEVAVSRLRQKLLTAGSQVALKSVRNMGVVLEMPTGGATPA